MTATMTARQVIEEITGDKRIHDDGYIQRFGAGNAPGDCLPQGDVYLTMLAGVPRGAKKIEARAKIAEGDTQGARHILDSLAGVTMYDIKDKGNLDGPIMVLAEERTLTHPEHRHVRLAPGCYGVHYQRNLDAEEREQRVLD